MRKMAQVLPLGAPSPTRTSSILDRGARSSNILRSPQQIVPLAVIKARRRRQQLVRFILSITTGHNGHERYSIAKFLAFERYMESTSLLRALAVLFLSPMPGLLASLIPSAVPLSDPLLGAAANVAFFAQLSIIVLLVAIGVVMYIQDGANIPRQCYSNAETLVVAVVCTSLHMAMMFALASKWRFPIPFMWGTGTPVFSMNLGIAHLLVLRGKLFGPTGLIAATMVYVPALVIQFLQIFIYPAFSALFERSTNSQRIAMTILFPFVKFSLRKLLRRCTRRLGDRSGEVTVTGVEICGTLYQSMIMQAAPSGVATIIIMTIDVVVGVLTIKMFMEKKSVVRQNQILATAFQVLHSEAVRETTINAASSSRSSMHLIPLTETTVSTGAGPSLATILADTTEPFDAQRPVHQHQVIRHALELVSTSESILLMEYFEVTIPIVSVVFIAIASQFSAAQYDPKLSVFADDSSRLVPVAKALALYSLLQALSLAGMHVVMKRRYGLSALYHLVFTLEYHARSIQGKLLGWILVILHFNGAHYGAFCVRGCLWRLLSLISGVNETDARDCSRRHRLDVPIRL